MQKSWARDYFESILIAVIFALFARTWVIQAFKIPSESMEDNLLVGDHILVNKFIYGVPSFHALDRLLPMRDVRRNDIIVFKYPKEPERDFIKRVIAVGGDTVMLKDRQVYVNGEKVNESRYAVYKQLYGVNPIRQRLMDNMEDRLIDKDTYFVMGDNRNNSDDSRFWGTVPRQNLKGRALLIYWSYEAQPGDYTAKSPLEKIETIGSILVHFPTRTRWGRTFRLIR
jgi:signal peptidase I